MKPKNEDFGILKNEYFEALKPSDLLQIKGGDGDQGGTDTVKDGDFD